jgi:hypothetical protein
MDPRIGQFEGKYLCRLLGMLGSGPGQDGRVVRSDRMTAVKFFDLAERFARERLVYEMLQSSQTVEIAGHAIPELIRADADLLAIEISIVERPFLLDFAGAKWPTKCRTSSSMSCKITTFNFRKFSARGGGGRFTSPRCFGSGRG